MQASIRERGAKKHEWDADYPAKDGMSGMQKRKRKKEWTWFVDKEPQVVSSKLLIVRNMSGLSYEKKNQIFLYVSISCTLVILM